MTSTDRDERAKAQLRALAAVVGAPGMGGGLAETLTAIADGVRSAFRFDAVVDLLDEENGVYVVKAGAGEGVARLIGTAVPRDSLDKLLTPRFEVIADVYFVPHGADVDWTELGDLVFVPDLEWMGEGHWHPEDACLVRLRTSHGRSVGLLSVHSPTDQLVPDESTFELLRLFAVVGANAVETILLQGRMAGMEAEREMAELRRDLYRTVSHELRTPLTSIRGLAHVAARETTSDERRRAYAELIAEQAEYLSEMLNDLLTAERAAAGGLPIECQAVAVDAAIDLAAVIAGLTGDPRLRIRSTGMLVVADPTRLAQAIANLLANAAKYAPEGLIYAQAWREGDRVLIEVEDDGPGIPEEELESVFNPFHRGGAPESSEGSGLGLYVTKQLVEAMGGTVTCRSQPRVGSRFSIELPSA